MAELFDVFFNGRPAAGSAFKGGINRKCAKCGDPVGLMEYDRVFDRIKLRCISCGYTWTAAPLTPNPEAK